MGAYVYTLLCADKSYYVGCATGDDLSKRVAEHETGVYSGYTSQRRPVRLVWSEHFDRITDAIATERKAALANKGWTQVSLLAKRRGGRQ